MGNEPKNALKANQEFLKAEKWNIAPSIDLPQQSNFLVTEAKTEGKNTHKPGANEGGCTEPPDSVIYVIRCKSCISGFLSWLCCGFVPKIHIWNATFRHVLWGWSEALLSCKCKCNQFIKLSETEWFIRLMTEISGAFRKRVECCRAEELSHPLVELQNNKCRLVWFDFMDLFQKRLFQVS